MPNTKGIAGLQRGADFEREVHESQRVERIQREVKTNSKAEVNEPLIQAAVQAGQEVADSMGFGRQVNVKYDSENDLVIMQIMDKEGKEVVRQIPPEEMIRTAERVKKQQAQFLDSIM